MNRDQGNARWILCPICGNKTRTKVFEDTIPTVLPQMQNRSPGRYFTTENDSNQMSQT